jgi:hypothetical protein
VLGVEVLGVEVLGVEVDGAEVVGAEVVGAGVDGAQVDGAEVGWLTVGQLLVENWSGTVEPPARVSDGPSPSTDAARRGAPPNVSASTPTADTPAVTAPIRSKVRRESRPDSVSSRSTFVFPRVVVSLVVAQRD